MKQPRNSKKAKPDKETKAIVDDFSHETWEQRVDRVLPEYVEPPYVEFDPATEQDVAILAQAYADDPGIAQLLREVGTHQIFTEAQQQRMDQFSTSNERIDWSRRDPLLVDIAQALARRVVAGQMADAFILDAKEFIHDRFFTRKNSHMDGQTSIKNGQDSPAAEAVDMARFLYAQDRCRALFFRPWNPDREFSEEDEDDIYMDTIKAQYQKTHGLYIRRWGAGSAIMLLDAMRCGLLASLDGPEALEYALTARIVGSRETII